MHGSVRKKYAANAAHGPHSRRGNLPCAIGYRFWQRAGMGTNYVIFIEDYVLSYLKREVDSLELSEIYFYGKRENGGRKFLVYGAGRQKEIAAFAAYELLDELVCRLTQAGPVFMVREKNGDYKTCSFRTFYADNEAMQNYLIEWTSGLEKERKDRKTDFDCNRPGLTQPRKTASVSHAPLEAKEKGKSGSAISVQLGLILVVLVAIVISSANSYHKMERMNQSAREVFFAIENQEAGQENEENKALESEPAGDRAQQGKQGEILVERNTDDISVEDAVRAENAAQADRAADAEADSGRSGTDTEDGSRSGTDEAENGQLGTDTEGGSQSGMDAGADQAADSGRSEDESQAETGKAADSDASAQEEDSSEEALSRNITRFYEVERGDTLYTISQKIYGDASRVEKICELNEISDPDKISEGQKIILP